MPKSPGRAPRPNSCLRSQAPEMNFAQDVTVHPRLQQPLRGVVYCCKHPVSSEGEYRRVRMKRTKTPECQIRKPSVEPGEYQLNGEQQADQRRDEAPDCGRDRELSHAVIVVAEALLLESGSGFIHCHAMFSSHAAHVHSKACPPGGGLGPRTPLLKDPMWRRTTEPVCAFCVPERLHECEWLPPDIEFFRPRNSQDQLHTVTPSCSGVTC